jgi:hypothetical protein
VIGLLKLGAIVGVSYAVGGSLGAGAWRMVKPDATAGALEGAAWGGRAVTLAILGTIFR